MGSSAHTTGQPQSLRELLSRDSRGIAGRDRQRTADNRWGVYVKPLGRGLHLVKNSSNDRSYRVGSALGRETFTPGSEVLLASNAGHPGEIIIGLPPPGRMGESGFAPNTQRVNVPAPVVEEVAETSYYALFNSSGDLTLSEYGADGEWESDIAQKTVGGDGPVMDWTYAITTDSAGNVGDGSMAWTEDDGTIYVWDPVSNTVHSQAATSPRDVVTSPVYNGGYVYWVETEGTSGSQTSTFYLMRASADLTGTVTLGNVTIPHAVQNYDWEGGSSGGASMHSTGPLFAVYGRDSVNHETTAMAELKFDFDGNDESSQINGSSTHGVGIGYLGGGDEAIGIQSQNESGLQYLDDAPGSPWQSRWPTTGAWAMSDYLLNVHGSTDGATALLYGVNAGVETVLVSPSDAVAGDPDTSVEISDHPTLAVAPNMMFMKE